MGDDQNSKGRLHCLHDIDRPMNAALDVVAVNGLNGDPWATWTTDGLGQPCMWIRDLLPMLIKRARTFTYQYNSFTSVPHGCFTPDGFDRAVEELIQALEDKRPDECPITFIAHDIGGLIVMKALLVTKSRAEPSVWRNGLPKLVFFGTPQTIRDIKSWEDSLFRLAFATTPATDLSPGLFAQVREMSRMLWEVARDFSHLVASHCVVNIYEQAADGRPIIDNSLSTTAFIYDVQVPRQTSHQDLCKFHQSDETLQIIKNALMPEIDQHLLKCFSKLASLAPQFQLPNQQHCDQKTILALNSLVTKKTSSAIYLHSPPGTGKGNIGAALFRLQRQLHQGFVGYYSFSARDLQRTTTASLLSCLIYQILSSDPTSFETVRNFYITIEKQSLWNLYTIWTMLCVLLSNPRFTSFIFIVNGVHDWDSSGKEYLQQLSHPRFSAPVKFVFIGEFLQSLAEFFQCDIIELDSRDVISPLVRERIDDLLKQLSKKSYLITPDAKTSLEDKLLSCQNLTQILITVEVIQCGMRNGITYMGPSTTELEGGGDSKWPRPAAMTFDTKWNSHCAVSPYHPISLSSELDLLPYDISSFVASTFNTLPEWALKALGWILRACRPLSISELTQALSLVEIGDTVTFDKGELFLDATLALKRAFGPLLKTENHGLVLCHEQVKDSFLQIVDIKHKNPTESELQTPVAKKAGILSHWDISRILLKFLNSAEFTDDTKEALRKAHWVNPQDPTIGFATYAVLFWPEHFREATKQGSYAEQLLGCLSSQSFLEEWQELYRNLGGTLLPPDIVIGDPLLLAAHLGFSDVVDICLPDRAAEDWSKILVCACYSGDQGIVKKILLSNESKKPSSEDKKLLEKGLIEASRRGYEDVTVLLLNYFESLQDSKADVLRRNAILLCDVAELGFFPLVQRYVEDGAPVDATNNGSSPLQLASKNGHELIVQYLLGHGADADANHSKDVVKPILHAAAKGYKAVAESLLTRANPYQQDGDNKTTLHLAAQNGHQRVVDLLLGIVEPPKLTDKDKAGRTVLHLAAQNGHAGIVQALVKFWKDGIDWVDNDQHSALRLASQAGQQRVVEILLENGAKANVVGADGHTALYSAVRGGYEAIASCILEQDNGVCDLVDAKDILHEAARHGFYPVCSFCVKQLGKEGLDSMDEKGRTALYYAAVGGYIEIAALLLDRGANVELEMNDGTSRTPLTAAALASQWACLEVLLLVSSGSKKASEYGGLLKALVDLRTSSSAGMADHIRTIRVLLEFGVDPSRIGPGESQSALHDAAAAGKVEVISAFLEYGADPCLKSSFCGWTPIFYAVRDGREQAVQFLLERIGGVLVQDDDGWSLLYLAAFNDHMPVMKLLVKADRKILKVRTLSGQTPLHSAANPEIARYLLQNGIDKDTQNNEGETALMSAMHRASVAKEILEFKPDLRLTDKSGRNVIHRAIQRGLDHVLSLLLDACDGDASVANAQDRDSMSPLHIAVYESDIISVECLLDSKSKKQTLNVDPNLQDSRGNTPLLQAVRNRNRDIIERLLKFGVDANIQNHSGDTALLVAVAEATDEGKTDIVEQLLRFGADANIRNNKDQTASLLAIENGMKQLLKLLLDKGKANVNEGNERASTVLHSLAMNGDLETIKELISFGADVNMKGGKFNTALQAAAAGGFGNVVLHLLDAKADASITGGRYGHVLTAAAFSGLDSCLSRILKEQGVDVDLQDEQGRTALHMAAWRGDEKNFMLLKNVANILLTDLQGRTVLHHAAAGGSREIVELLLKDPNAGSLNIEDKDGWLPLHWGCRSVENDEIVTLLTSHRHYELVPAEKDVCWSAERIARFHDAPELLNNKSLMENRATSQAVGYCHWGYTCDGCDQEPIYGIRWRCTTCVIPFDFCFKCAKSRAETHPAAHKFAQEGREIA